MDYTHKFPNGSPTMDHMCEEYLSMRKVRGYCKKCPNYGKYWSCPEFAFNEILFLNEFQYMYPIGREYTIPKKDRQKTIGIQACANYCNNLHKAMKIEAWRDLLAFEKAVPGTLALVPGNCHICEAQGMDCARQKGLKCRYAHMMRFSPEALGFDVDAISKFEIGMLLRWPREGHLPEKMSCVMAILSNKKIPRALLKKYFPDVKKTHLKAGQTILGSEEGPKRAESWLAEQAEEIRAKEEAEGDHGSWLGFKSEALDSGDYVKERPWAQGDDEYPDEPPDVSDRAEGDRVEVREAPKEPEAPKAEFKALPSEEEAEELDENGEPKYKWVGFKRSPEEAEEMMYSRPIPKFNISDEEKEAQDAAIDAVVHGEEQTASDASDEAPVEKSVEKPESEPAPASKPETKLAPKPEPAPEPVSEPEPDSGSILAEMEQSLRQKMPGASDREIFSMMKEALAEEMANAKSAQSAQTAAVAKAPKPAPAPEPEPEPVKEAPKPKPEPVVLPDAASVGDVLGAALAIAQAVSSEPEPEPEPALEKNNPRKEAVALAAAALAAEMESSGNGINSHVSATVEEAPEPVSEPEPVPAPAPAPEPEPAEEEDDSKYKWLGFKATLKEDDDFKKGGWKKNY